MSVTKSLYGGVPNGPTPRESLTLHTSRTHRQTPILTDTGFTQRSNSLRAATDHREQHTECICEANGNANGDACASPPGLSASLSRGV